MGSTEHVASSRTIHVDLLRADQLEAASTVLADAFAATAYPWTVWTVASDGHHERLQKTFELFLKAVALPHGLADTVESEGRVMGVAVWLPPDAPIPPEVWQRVGEVQMILAGDRAEAAMRADAELAQVRPDAPHVTLATVAVAPTRHGLGYGRALLQHGLRRAGAAGLPTYLETSSSSNVRFYESLGFVVVATLELPDGGPTVWAMRRPADLDESTE